MHLGVPVPLLHILHPFPRLRHLLHQSFNCWLIFLADYPSIQIGRKRPGELWGCCSARIWDKVEDFVFAETFCRIGWDKRQWDTSKSRAVRSIQFDRNSDGKLLQAKGHGSWHSSGDIVGVWGRYVRRHSDGAPPPPRAQEPPYARTAPWFRGRILAPLFFTTVLGFSWFWWMRDSYLGVQDKIVLLRVPPSWGDPISQSQVHIPLKPLPPALDPFPKATSPDKETNKSQLNTGGH